MIRNDNLESNKLATQTNEVNLPFILLTAVAVFFSWILHEFAHYSMGTLLGYKMSMNLNQAYPLIGHYDNKWDYEKISAAGPIVTMLQAIMVFIIMKRKQVRRLYPFLFSCFYMRLLATVISLKRPNDEARISYALGIGKFTLPVLVTCFLFILLYNISNHYLFSNHFNLRILVIVIIFSSLIILSNKYISLTLL